jgi:hypothetical protein
MCCLLACVSASAAPVPEPDLPYSSSLHPAIVARTHVALPEESRPHLLDKALYVSLAGYRAMDYFSTQHALAGGAHEMILPQWVVNNNSVFIAFEGIATAGEISSSLWLIRHGHRRMARAMNAVSLSLGVTAVVHNYTEPLAAAR